MSARVVALRARADALEVPAVIAGNVDLLRLTNALATAGLVGRFDGSRDVIVIEAAPARCPECGRTGLDEDATCGSCGGTGVTQH